MDDYNVQQNINFLEYPPYGASEEAFSVEERTEANNPRKKYRVYVFRQVDGYVLECKIGVPTFFDHLILMTLLLESQSNGFTSRIGLTRYKIAKTAGRATNKQTYSKIVDAIETWKDAVFRFDNSFHQRALNPQGKVFGEKVTTVFSAINSYREITDSKGAVTYEIELGAEYLHHVRASNFCKHLPLKEYRKFKSAVSARLFDLLTKSFYKSNTWEIKADKLGPKLTLPLNTYPSKVVDRIGPAIKNINKVCSEQYSWEKEKRGQGDILLKFMKLSNTPKHTQGELFQDRSSLKPKDKMGKLPDHIIEMLPENQVQSVTSVWGQVLNKLPVSVVEWYIQQTAIAHAKKVINNWGGYICTIVKAKAYDVYLSKQEEKKVQKAADKKAHDDKVKAELERQEERIDLKQASNLKENFLNDLTDAYIDKLDSFIKSKLNEYNKKRFAKGKKRVLRLQYVDEWVEQSGLTF